MDGLSSLQSTIGFRPLDPGYSEDLVRIRNHCLLEDPRCRPNSDGLLESIRQALKMRYSKAKINDYAVLVGVTEACKQRRSRDKSGGKDGVPG